MKHIAAENPPPDVRWVRGLWLGMMVSIAGPLLVWGWSAAVLPWMGFPAGGFALCLLVVNARAARPREVTITADGFLIEGQNHPAASLVLRQAHGQPAQLCMNGRPMVTLVDASPEQAGAEAERIAALFGVDLTDERVSSTYGSHTRDNAHVQRLRARVEASMIRDRTWYRLDAERPRVEQTHSGMSIRVGDGGFSVSTTHLERDGIVVNWSSVLEIGLVIENVVRVEIVSESGPLALLVVDVVPKHVRQALWVLEQLQEYRVRYGGWTPGSALDVPARLAAMRTIEEAR